MDFLPWTTFARIVSRYGGDHRVRTLAYTEQYRAMAFAQLNMEAIDVAYGTLGPGLFNVSSDLQRLFAGPGPVAATPPPKPLSSPPARP